MLECDHAEKLAGINRRSAIEIIQMPHLPGEIGTRQDPSTAQASNTVNLRQTTGHHEFRSDVKRCSRCPLIHRIQINLVHQHERSNAARDVANLAQNRIRREHTGRIVQVRDHDKPRLRRDTTANRLWIDGPAVFFGPRKPFHVRLKILGNVENWAVCRMLD